MNFIFFIVIDKKTILNIEFSNVNNARWDLLIRNGEDCFKFSNNFLLEDIEKSKSEIRNISKKIEEKLYEFKIIKSGEIELYQLDVFDNVNTKAKKEAFFYCLFDKNNKSNNSENKISECATYQKNFDISKFLK